MSKPIAMQTSLSEAEATLRLLASLPAPEGLEARVRSALKTKSSVGKVIAWPVPVSPARGWLRGAAAAAIVGVIAGGSWGVYSRVQPGTAPHLVEVPRAVGSGGFSNAGAMRTPQTLVAPATSQSTTVQQSAPAQTPPVSSGKTTGLLKNKLHKQTAAR